MIFARKDLIILVITVVNYTITSGLMTKPVDPYKCKACGKHKDVSINGKYLVCRKCDRV